MDINTNIVHFKLNFINCLILIINIYSVNFIMYTNYSFIIKTSFLSTVSLRMATITRLNMQESNNIHVN